MSVASQTPLVSTIFSLVPSSSYQQTISQISLLSVHVEPYDITDEYFHTTTIIPGQTRMVRLRATRRLDQPKGKGKASQAGEKEDGVDEYTYSLNYLSQPLPGREYADMNVRGTIGVNIVGDNDVESTLDFLSTLGFTSSHSYSRKGTLFHIPTPHPSLTLQLTVTKLSSRSPSSSASSKNDDEPWLVQLQPSRPVSVVPATKGDLGLNDVMDLMKSVASRIDGLDWGTGR